MDNKIHDFLSSETHYGIQLDELYSKIYPLFGVDRCTELKLLCEYYNIQLKKGLKTSTCYKDIIDVYYKQIFYFDLFENVLLCVPYIKRELKEFLLKTEEQQDIDNMIKNIVENLNSYKIYFKYFSSVLDLHQYELIKIKALLKYVLEKDNEIRRKLEIGYTLNEMISREKTFITNLSVLLKVFESNLDHSKENLFVMDKIYVGQVELLNDLKKCEWDCDVNYFIECYAKRIDLFRLYAEDQRLKSAEIINTLPENFKEKLKAYNCDLYVCIKHLMPYRIFFEKLEKLEPDLKSTIKDVRNEIISVNRQADDLFAVANILRCNIHLNRIGNLIARGPATFLRKQDHELFLFEDALIITEVQSKVTEKFYKHLPENSGTNPVVYYKTHILKDFLEIVQMENNKLIFKKKLCVEENDYNFTIENDIFKECLLQYLEK